MLKTIFNHSVELQYKSCKSSCRCCRRRPSIQVVFLHILQLRSQYNSTASKDDQVHTNIQRNATTSLKGICKVRGHKQLLLY